MQKDTYSQAGLVTREFQSAADNAQLSSDIKAVLHGVQQILC